jgi:uncharacterized membrane protein YjjP (DUF1212 family)
LSQSQFLFELPLQVDAAMLNYQNQKLEQQIDVHKNEINALQSKLSQLRHKQEPHEDSFHAVRDAWISVSFSHLSNLYILVHVNAKAQML